MSIITCQNSYGFRAIWSWQISSFFLDLLEIQEITEILEIQAQICLNVSRMMQGVIGAISRGGLGGRKPPQGVDPLPSWLGRRVGRKKVASILLKIAQQVAYR